MTNEAEIFRDTLIAEAGRLDVPLSPEALDLCSRHYDLLRKWNPRVRLVGSVEPVRAAVELFADSLVATQFATGTALCGAEFIRPPLSGRRMGTVPEAYEFSAVDIGSGAGFPGVVAKIAYPDWTVTLLESNRKKSSFLKTVLRELGLQRVDVVTGRAEDLVRNENLKEQFHLAFCRAVAAPTLACGLALPFLKLGGVFIAQTGALESNERETLRIAAARLGATIEATYSYRLTGLARDRSLIAIRKTAATLA